MAPAKKDQIRALLKSIETGDPGPVAVVNEAKYIQHNPQTQEGSEVLAALFKRLSETNPRINVVRAFEDGDFVFGHTEYDFATRRIGFELFRFEAGQAVEHWDNIQARLGPNEAGRSLVDGPVDAVDLGQTESNRTLIRSFVEMVLIGGQLDRLSEFVADDFAEHNPRLTDGVSALRARWGLETSTTTKSIAFWLREILSSVSARAKSAASILPSTISSGRRGKAGGTLGHHREDRAPE